MKYYLIISSLLCLGIFISCSTSETESKNSAIILAELPKINDLFHPRGVSDFLLLISPSQFSRAYSVNCKNIHYDIAVKADNHFKKVVYISTDDKSFVTPEKLKINDSLSDVRSVSENEILTYRGWAFVIPLESGWNAAFVEGESMTDGTLNSDSQISFFFKR
jgi:hypothetical protein